jgi:hypothetical protein
MMTEPISDEDLAGWRENVEPWTMAMIARIDAAEAERDAVTEVVFHLREALCKAEAEVDAVRAELNTVTVNAARSGVYWQKRALEAEDENACMIKEFAGFVYGECPKGKHADYGFNHENSTMCPGCEVEAVTAERDRLREVVAAAEAWRKADARVEWGSDDEPAMVEAMIHRRRLDAALDAWKAAQ